MTSLALACSSPESPEAVVSAGTMDSPAPATYSLEVPFDTVAFRKSQPDDIYLLALPNKPQGLLVLLPGFGQDPGSIPASSDLPRLALAAQYAVVLVGNGPQLAPTLPVLTRLHEAIAHVLKRHPELEELPAHLGGFSAGGTIGLRYVEYLATRDDRPLAFRSVFAVDSPTDLFEIEAYARRELARSRSEIGMNEAQFIRAHFRENLGELPMDSAAYLAASPYARHLSQPGNETGLLGTRVRTYHDIDVNWLIAERGRSAYDANFLCSSALINDLIQAGHQHAEFIQSDRPGMRPDGQRHPHSWNIVDGEELVQWLSAGADEF